MSYGKQTYSLQPDDYQTYCVVFLQLTVYHICGVLGSSLMYRFIRKEVGINFYHGDRTLDIDLEKLHSAITNHSVDKVIMDIFGTYTDSSKQISILQKMGLYSRL